MIKKLLKRLAILILAIFILLLLTYGLLQLSSVQNYIKDKILTSLSEHYDAQWTIESIDIDFFDEVNAKGILLLDQQNDTLLAAEQLEIDISIFSLLDRQIDIDKITLTDPTMRLREQTSGKMNFDFLFSGNTAQDTITKPTNSKPWSFHIDDIEITNSDIIYATSSQYVKYTGKLLSIQLNSLDFGASSVGINHLTIENSVLTYQSMVTNEDMSTEPFSLPDFGWNIASDHIDLTNINTTLIQATDTIEITDIHTSLRDIEYTDTRLTAALEELRLRYNDQFNIEQATVDLTIDRSEILAQELTVKTQYDHLSLGGMQFQLDTHLAQLDRLDLSVSEHTLTTLRPMLPSDIQLIKGNALLLNTDQIIYRPDELRSKQIDLKYGRTIQLQGRINKVSLDTTKPIYTDAILKQLRIDIPQIQRMLPNLSLPDSLNNYNTLSAQGAVSGMLNDLVVDNLSITVDDVFASRFSGKVSNAGIPSELSLQVNIEELRSDVRKLPLPAIDGVAIDSLGEISYTGKISGTLSNLSLDGKLQTALGTLDADIRLNIPENIENTQYQGKLQLDKFDVGALLQNPDFDRISINTQISGTGFDLNNIDSAIEGTVSDFSYHGYTYDAIQLNAKINDHKIDGNVSINDKNVKVNFNGLVSLGEDRSLFDFTAQIDTLQLAELGLYGPELSAAGKIEAQLSLPLLPGEKGNISITNLTLRNPNEAYSTDTILISAQKTTDSTHVQLLSDFAKININGTFGIRQIPNTFIYVIDHYYDIAVDSTMVFEDNHNVNLDATIYSLQPIDVAIGRKTSVQTRRINIDLAAAPADYQLNGQIVMDSLYYNDIFSEELKVDISTDTELDIVVKGSNNSFSNTALPVLNNKNSIVNNTISSSTVVADEDQLPRLKVITTLENTEEALLVSLKDSLILNQKDWTIQEDNEIRISGSDIYISNFALTDQNEYMTLSSIGDDGDDFKADFNNFNIGQFMSLLTMQESELTGNINGSLEIRDYDTEYYYLIDLVIDDIVYDSSAVGELNISANEKKGSEQIEAQFSLIGKDNNVQGSGTYNKSTTEKNVNIDIDRLEMLVLDPFMAGIITDSEGIMKGQVSLQGTNEKPVLDGSVTLQNAVTTIIANGARYGIDDHQISFNNNEIDLGTLDLFDIHNNVATVSGKIYHNFLDDIEVDLQIDTDKFLALNTSSADNPIFYGTAVIAANGTIIGPPDLMKLDLRVTTLDGSEVTISPFSATESLLTEDFIQYGRPEDFEYVSDQQLLRRNRQLPFDVNMLLDVTTDAKLNLIVDPVTGDKIEGTGTSNLRIKINPDATQEIYGIYTVVDGSYSFSYGDFVSKKFKVESGGTVRFNGNPLTAVLDIDAVYSVYTTTYELIKNEITIDDSEIAAAKKRRDVNVYLSLAGSLSSPKLDLDIRIPTDDSGSIVSAIDRKLNELRNNPNELNNQVFGLLLFDSFLLSDASSGVDNLGSNIALSSISNLISSQLNRLASSAIKGVDIAVDVNSYESQYVGESGGNVTEIGLQVSKRLFDDRLTVTAGGNFDLANSSGTSNTSYIGDFVLEYKLTENGRYRLRVFSKSAYDRLLDENTNRNGVGIFFNRTFDSKTDGK